MSELLASARYLIWHHISNKNKTKSIVHNKSLQIYNNNKFYVVYTVSLNTMSTNKRKTALTLSASSLSSNFVPTSDGDDDMDNLTTKQEVCIIIMLLVVFNVGTSI